MNPFEAEIRRIVREEVSRLVPQKKSLAEHRKAAGMNQKKLHEQSGVGLATISLIESGKVRAQRRTKERLAKTLKIKVTEIE